MKRFGEIETKEANQISFESFAAHPFYISINRSLVQQAFAPFVALAADTILTIIDIACGIGTIPQLIAEEMAHLFF